jgi:hypothetical protein
MSQHAGRKQIWFFHKRQGIQEAALDISLSDEMLKELPDILDVLVHARRPQWQPLSRAMAKQVLQPGVEMLYTKPVRTLYLMHLIKPPDEPAHIDPQGMLSVMAEVPAPCVVQILLMEFLQCLHWFPVPPETRQTP